MSSSKRSEAEYLRRTSGGAWEGQKPFSPPGTDTLEESGHLILDFAVLLRCLQPAATDLILDLGSGGGWCSDWLGRLNYRTIAVDISHDMLCVARSRTDPRRTSLVAGDFEALPFAAGAFDKACCLNALHHVPDIPKALGEICRVLGPAGLAVFAEPGAGHSAKPVSVAAMRTAASSSKISSSRRSCQLADAGFTDVRIQPVAYVLPEST
jgi:ubiquinone/menaquinone biosynthesis C-methylase UbiE